MRNSIHSNAHIGIKKNFFFPCQQFYITGTFKSPLRLQDILLPSLIVMSNQQTHFWRGPYLLTYHEQFTFNIRLQPRIHSFSQTTYIGEYQLPKDMSGNSQLPYSTKSQIRSCHSLLSIRAHWCFKLPPFDFTSCFLAL